MAKLTYQDLLDKGLELTKDEATSLQSGITHISKFGHDGANDVFDYDKTGKSDGTGGGLSSVKATPGFEPNQKKEEPAKPETPKQKKEREAKEKKAAEEETARLAKLKEEGLEERAVTQEDLDDDPTLVEAGVAVGDVHQFKIATE